MGVHAKYGARQPTLEVRLADPKTNWEALTVAWYGGQQRIVEVASDTAIWYHNGLASCSHPASFCSVIRSLILPPSHCSALITRSALPKLSSGLSCEVRVEVTLHEGRAHLGMETQRQWSDLAILRTTPALLGLFSLVTLFVQALLNGQPLLVRQTVWYTKAFPTFADTLAFVRQQLWLITLFCMSPANLIYSNNHSSHLAMQQEGPLRSFHIPLALA